MLKSKKDQRAVKLNELRIGNHVGLAYNPFVISGINSIHEDGTIQLCCNSYADEIRDIIGVPLTKRNLKRLRIPDCFVKGGIQFNIELNESNAINLSSVYGMFQLNYLHKIENLIWIFSGIELLTQQGKFNVMDEK